MKHVGWIMSGLGAFIMACAKEWRPASYLMGICTLNYIIARDDK